jgi:hypothetical protein
MFGLKPYVVIPCPVAGIAEDLMVNVTIPFEFSGIRWNIHLFLRLYTYCTQLFIETNVLLFVRFHSAYKISLIIYRQCSGAGVSKFFNLQDPVRDYLYGSGPSINKQNN